MKTFFKYPINVTWIKIFNSEELILLKHIMKDLNYNQPIVKSEEDDDEGIYVLVKKPQDWYGENHHTWEMIKQRFYVKRLTKLTKKIMKELD